MGKIDVLVVRPMEAPKMEKVEASLDGYYGLIGCSTIQAIYPFDDPVALVCDDEGKLTRKKPNRALKADGEVYDVVFGTFFVCGLGEEDFCSLTDEQAKKYAELFKNREAYARMGGHVVRVVENDAEPPVIIA